MITLENIPPGPDEPLFVIGLSGRLPRRTVCALELSRAELPGHLHEWQSLLGDRLRTAPMGHLSHPSRLVKRERPYVMRRLTEALADFPRHHIIQLSKRHAQQAERDILDCLCGFLKGPASGLAVIHATRGITWARLTAGGPRPLHAWPPAYSTAEVEPLLSAAKLAAYAAYQHHSYPNEDCRPSWLPQKLTWAGQGISN